MSQVLPKLTPIDKKCFLAKYGLIGREEYRAINILNLRVDNILTKWKTTIAKLHRRLRIKLGLYVKYDSIMTLFSLIFPAFKTEIHNSFILAKKLVCEERGDRE
jgi:hypothetical protein